MIKLTPYFNKVDSYNNLSEFPHTLLLLGDTGSGRHTVGNYIVKKFNVPYIDLTNVLNTSNTEQFSNFVFTNMISSTVPKMYFIDFDKIYSNKELKQNNILKLLEEPQSNIFIVMFAVNNNSVLGTIYNRCQVWKLPTYTKTDLFEFTKDTLVLDVANTPGQVIKLNNIDIKALSEYAKLVIDKAASSNFSNVLTIPDHIAFIQEPDKDDVDLFIRFLLYYAKQAVLSKYNRRNYYIFECTRKLFNTYYSVSVDAKMLFHNYLTKLKLGDYYNYEY